MNPSPATTTTTKGGDFLTFALGNEEFGLCLLQVREIISYMQITAVPRTPAFVRGVINLRGQVIAVIDLRTKFAMPPVAPTEQTCIIVVEITTGTGRTLSTGIIVDRVSEVLRILSENVEDAPDFGSAVDGRFILGMGKVGERVKILLDINRVLATDEVESLATTVVPPATGTTTAAAA